MADKHQRLTKVTGQERNADIVIQLPIEILVCNSMNEESIFDLISSTQSSENIENK